MKDMTIDGYVTKNVRVEATRNGRTVTRFSVNSPNYDRETRQSTPQFFECEYWHSGPQDDKAANIAEGALLLLWGQLAYDSWQDRQTGQNRSKVYLKVREVGVIRPPQGRPAQQPAPQRYAPQPAYAPQAPAYPPQGPAPAPAAAQPAYAPQAAPAAAQQPPLPSIADVYDEDIPF